MASEEHEEDHHDEGGGAHQEEGGQGGHEGPGDTAKARDPRLPAPGGVIEKVYKNQKITVQVTETGFTYDGAEYSSLTALALKITGYRAVSGPRFFGLVKPAPSARRARGGSRGRRPVPRGAPRGGPLPR